MSLSPSQKFAALIGIDWSDRKHDICLFDLTTQEIEFSQIAHSPEAIEAWVHLLSQRFPGQTLAICTEQKRGPLVYALHKYEQLTLYPVNPQTVASYRKAFKPSRSKDDPSDAFIMMDLLRRHRDKLSPWSPDSTSMRQLQSLVEMRRKLVQDRVRCTNQLIGALKNFYPQAVELFADKSTLIFCDFVTQYPNLETAQAATEEELCSFFKQHNSMYPKINQARIQLIQEAIPLTQEQGVILPFQMMAQAIATQLRVLLGHIQVFENAIAELFAAHEDAFIFESLPGAGPNLAPRLLAAFGEQRSRYGSAQELSQFVGVAPVTEASGKKKWVHWRWFCPKFLRQSFVEWADYSRQYSFWAKAFYAQQKSQGKSHQVIMRALAFKWIRILYRCWQDRKPYDEAKYLLALQKKGSPLVAHLAG